MKHNILYYGSLIVVLFAIGLGIYILSLLFLPLKPIELYGPFPVKTKIVRKGDILIYTGNVCKNVKLVGYVARSLVDSIMYALPETTSNLPKGCRNIDVSVAIPTSIPTGTYYMKITVTYHMNPFRTFTARVDTDKFQVVD